MKRLSCLYAFAVFYFLCLGCLFSPSSSAFTVKDILSAPFPENLATGARTLAWTLNDEGRRNVWVAAAPDFKPVQLTSYERDNGIKLSGLAFTPDDAMLVYVRGGAAEETDTPGIVSGPSGAIGVYRTGTPAFPNPSGSPDITEQAVWAVSTKGGSPWKLALGGHPVVSPVQQDPLSVLFTKGGQFYEVPLKPERGQPLPDPKPLFHIQGSNKNAVWSPDGERLLFVSDRDTHSLIGLFHKKTRKIEWIMPGADRDMSPVWSPDGSRIAFIRVPGKTKNELFDLTAEFAFSICVADVKTGKGKVIWQTPETGGWAQWYPTYAGWFSQALRWTKNNRILFYSEHKDWLHIYSTTPTGKDLKDLTPGSSQVWESAVSPDGTLLYYSTNQDNLDLRHIWQAPTAGGTPVQITQGRSIETSPVTFSKTPEIAFLKATAVAPQAVTIKKPSQKTSRSVSPASLPEQFPDDLVTPQQVILPSDEFKIHCQLFKPENPVPGETMPGIIFVHGGPFRQMMLGWSHHASYSKTYAMNQYLANRGYVVLSVNYRSGTGYGRAFRRAKNQGPRGASEYRDVLVALYFLSNRPEVDPKRIGIWGNSCGGYLTGLSLARNSDLFAAGVALSGIYDFSFRATHMSVPGGEWGIKGKKGLALAFRSSPMADIGYWRSPVLLVHGDDDRSVIFAQTVNLVQGLRKRDIDMELLVLPGESHDYALHKNWVRTFEAAGTFFDRVLPP